MSRQLEFIPILVGFVIGTCVSLMPLLGLPFALGICFFLIGSEANPLGPTLFIVYLAIMVLSTFVGCIVGCTVGLLVKRDAERRP